MSISKSFLSNFFIYSKKKNLCKIGRFKVLRVPVELLQLHTLRFCMVRDSQNNWLGGKQHITIVKLRTPYTTVTVVTVSKRTRSGVSKVQLLDDLVQTPQPKFKEPKEVRAVIWVQKLKQFKNGESLLMQMNIFQKNCSLTICFVVFYFLK